MKLTTCLKCTSLLVLAAFCSAQAEDGATAGQLGQQVLARYADQQMNFEQFAEKQPNLVSWIGVGANAEQIEASVESMVFSALLAREASSQGLQNEEETKAQIDSLLANALLKKRVPREKITVEESEIEQYYRKNRSNYATQEQVTVSHILTGKLEDAEKARAEIKSGADFKAIAAKYSIDTLSAKRGGSLGLIAPNSLLPELRAKLKTLQVGEISSPVKTSLGYHLLKQDQAPATSYRPLDEVKKDVYQEVFRAKEQAAIAEVRKELFKKYNAEIESDTIEQVLQAKTTENAVQVAQTESGKARRQPGQATDLQVVSEIVKLGSIPAKQLTETLLVQNSSDKEITVQRVGSTCPCMEVTLDQHFLKPGQQAKLTFSYNPDMYKEKGSIQKMVFIESTDRIEPRKFIRIDANVSRG